jgi:hypothetical protein
LPVFWGGRTRKEPRGVLPLGWKRKKKKKGEVREGGIYNFPVAEGRKELGWGTNVDKQGSCDTEKVPPTYVENFIVR